MKIPLYILGLLIRFGQQHGYQLKKIFEDQLSDFTQIKLPVIYYHLGKMEKEGLLVAGPNENPEKRKKTVYSITEKGKLFFYRLLKNFACFDYELSFDSDAVFFFSEQLESSLLLKNLKNHIENLKEKLNEIAEHKSKELRFLPDEAKKMALIIFSRHEHHYQAELNWALTALSSFKEIKGESNAD